MQNANFPSNSSHKKRVLITRALEQGEKTANKLINMGYEPILAPMREVVFLPFLFPDCASQLQALIATSANAFNGDALPSSWYNMPLFCVGETTAKIAKIKGFSSIFVIDGGVEKLAQHIIDNCPNEMSFIYLAGSPRRYELEEKLPRAGFSLQIIETYKMIEVCDLPQIAEIALKNKLCNAILHFSMLSAECFFKLCEKSFLEIEAQYPIHFCLSPVIAYLVEKYIKIPEKIFISKKMEEESLLKCLNVALLSGDNNVL